MEFHEVVVYLTTMETTCNFRGY